MWWISMDMHHNMMLIMEPVHASTTRTMLSAKKGTGLYKIRSFEICLVAIEHEYSGKIHVCLDSGNQFERLAFLTAGGILIKVFTP